MARTNDPDMPHPNFLLMLLIIVKAAWTLKVDIGPRVMLFLERYQRTRDVVDKNKKVKTGMAD